MRRNQQKYKKKKIMRGRKTIMRNKIRENIKLIRTRTRRRTLRNRSIRRDEFTVN
jgi:hypothetical protein